MKLFLNNKVSNSKKEEKVRSLESYILESKNGNQESFEYLINYLQNDLYKIAYTRLTSIDDINEAVQNTIIRIYYNLKKVKNYNYFKTWAIKILINEINKIYKTNKKRDSLKDISYYENTYFYNDISQMQKIENDIDFDKVMNTLKYDEKIIVILKYTDQYTFEDISKILRLNINTVKSKFFRSKEKLKKYYEERNKQNENEKIKKK